ncbi:carbohydrate kinase family protein [Oerskovia enterophila]|uniref:carbohydrate kinase family protein n=1 Tax=Oerskovia enterophila TaxID=43678 RepID=UPI003391B09F
MPHRSPHVLVVGEALIDEVRRPDGTTDEHPGGSPANVALTLGRLGRETRLAAHLGQDTHGETLRAWLAGSGVTLTPGSDGAAATSVARAVLDASGAATYDFAITWDVAPGTGADDATIAVHTGSIAAVLEPGADAVHDLVLAARERSTITYDPNARPSLMGTAEAALARIEPLVAAADVVKVSDEDVEWLRPGADPVEVARTWAAQGPAIVVVTFGGEGAVAVCPAGEVRVAAPRVDVVDTVGAGDTFMGALIDGLWERDLLGADRREALRAIDLASLTEVLEQCVAAAAITVSRAGANPPRRAELAHR